MWYPQKIIGAHTFIIMTYLEFPPPHFLMGVKCIPTVYSRHSGGGVKKKGVIYLDMLMQLVKIPVGLSYSDSSLLQLNKHHLISSGIVVNL